MPQDRVSDRARRLAVRRKAKAALGPLRSLVRVLAEWERLEGADAIGVVEIAPGTPEAAYGADVLDIVAYALSEAGDGQVVEVFVTTSAADQSIGRQPIGEEQCQADSTQTSAPRSAKRVPSPSAGRRTIPGA